MMKPTLSHVAVLAAGLAVAACSSSPDRINPTTEGVSYKYSGDKIEAAMKGANAHCSTYGRLAKLRTIAPQGDQSVAIFDCV